MFAGEEKQSACCQGQEAEKFSTKIVDCTITHAKFFVDVFLGCHRSIPPSLMRCEFHHPGNQFALTPVVQSSSPNLSSTIFLS